MHVDWASCAFVSYVIVPVLGVLACCVLRVALYPMCLSVDLYTCPRACVLRAGISPKQKTKKVIVVVVVVVVV